MVQVWNNQARRAGFVADARQRVQHFNRFDRESPMLKLKPGCEHCDRDLPANSDEARICSFECTFCAECVEAVLMNVCPNCGGGFEKRPVRPANDYRGAHTGNRPPSTERVHKPVDVAAHRAFALEVAKIPAGAR